MQVQSALGICSGHL